MASTNIDLLELAARHLEEIIDEVAFVGGSTVALLITDEAAPEVRPTVDVDLIVEVGSLNDYHNLGVRLRSKGFNEDSSDGAPLCRYRGHGFIVDVVPTDPKILGFSNRWYVSALRQAQKKILPSGNSIKVISAEYFIATKLEAFSGRGHGDYLASHDLEDIMAVIDGRPEIIGELNTADELLRSYVRERIQQLLEDPDFLEALPGFLPGDGASQQRLPGLMIRLKSLGSYDLGDSG